MFKFAKKNVNGWNNRYINQTKVYNNLCVRLRNGFTLTMDEHVFFHDYRNLIKLYALKKSGDL